VTRTASGFDVVTSDRPAAPTGAVSWYAEGFSDRFGDRLLLFDNAGPGLELLRFTATLQGIAGFEASLRARVDECAGFMHPAFAPIRSITILDDPRPQLALVSEHAPGERLSSILRTARQAGSRLHPHSAIWLLRRVTPGLAAFQDERPGSAHGCLTADRIVIAPTGDAIVTEYALGPALERLNLDRRALWREFGVLAGADGAPAFLGPRVDVVQLALIALALLLGRPLRHDELPDGLRAVVDAACPPTAVSPGLRTWIERALGIATPAFRTAREACDALDSLMPGLPGAWTTLPASGGDDSQALVRGSRPTSLGFAAGRAIGPRRALPAPKGDPVVVARRLRRVSWTLGAIALVEAAALVFVLTRPAPDVGMSAVVPAATVARDETAKPAAPRERASTPPPAVATAGASTTNTAERASTTPPAASTPRVIGWISVESDLEMRVYANGRLLGSAANARYRLPAGDHDITLVNDSIGLHATQPVRVVAGRTAIITPPTQ
jgi:hypothetical protein